MRDRPAGAVVKDLAIGAVGLGSIPGALESDSVANGSPLQRRFFRAVLPRR